MVRDIEVSKPGYSLNLVMLYPEIFFNTVTLYWFFPTVEPITIKGIKLFPEAGKIRVGTSASLTVEAQGTSPAYEWFRNEEALTDSTIYKGTTEATLHIEQATADLSGNYWCKVSNVKSPKKKIPRSQAVRLDIGVLSALFQLLISYLHINLH